MIFDLRAPATFSPCKRYRLTLRRDLGLFGDRPLISCGYNPSIAGIDINDPTIVREMGFGRSWGCSELIKVNALAGIATNPDDLADMTDPVGPLNDDAIRAAVAYADERDGILLACWGAPKGRAATRRLASRRLAEVAKMAPWQALRLTKSGYPQHPLYLPASLTPQPWMVT